MPVYQMLCTAPADPLHTFPREEYYVGMIKSFKLLFGIFFVLIGLFGFISNPLIGTNAIFVTNDSTNWLHLIAGIALLIADIYARRTS